MPGPFGLRHMARQIRCLAGISLPRPSKARPAAAGRKHQIGRARSAFGRPIRAVLKQISNINTQNRAQPWRFAPGLRPILRLRLRLKGRLASFEAEPETSILIINKYQLCCLTSRYSYTASGSPECSTLKVSS